MKFTLSWLESHLETDRPLETLTERLSMIGLELEGVEDRGRALAPFTVARVVEASGHPDADRLRVCRVETRDGEVQVVCGAPNARTGMYGIFAPAGTYIPGTGIDLKKGVIRGVESNGMLLSERELGLSDEHEGIIELEGEPPIGTPAARALGLDDPVIDIGVTPNRSDCLGVHGVARDLAAAGLGRLKPFAAEPREGTFKPPVKWRRELPEGRCHLCPYVAGRYFRGVTNGPSPQWLQDRLTSIGLRPISALVDITNFVTHDLGRPLHVFDADRLAGDPTMRLAAGGEPFEGLDERSYRVPAGAVVIHDGERVQGVGGIMGSAESGCELGTTNVFLEVALFDPVNVARIGRETGILSDARFRFERGLDPVSAEWGLHVATRLILDLCGGEASHPTSAGEIPRAMPTVALRRERVATLGGLALPDERQREILERLGFAVEPTAEGFACRIPTWRPDIEGEACLVEEILRIHGYDEIPVTPLPRAHDLPEPAVARPQRLRALARAVLAGRGFEEAVTFSFIRSDWAERFGGAPQALRLDNPISSELDQMRPSILPSLLEAAQKNSQRGFAEVRFFEAGPTYEDDSPSGQRDVVTGLRAGPRAPRHWAESERPLDAFDAKEDALAVLSALGAPVDNLQATADAPGWYHPGRSGCLRLGPKVLARFGELHPGALALFDLRSPTVAFEVFLEQVPAPKASGPAKPLLVLSPFQPVSRDFAFLVDAEVPAEKLIRAARGADKALVSEVALFDAYQGEGIPEGKKSLAIAVTLQPRDKTLTDAEIDAVGEKIVAQVAKATGGTLRS